jgi:hypothetical protein
MSTMDIWMGYTKKIADSQMKGKPLIKSEERKWEITKIGKLKYYLEPNTLKDNPLHDWYVFVNEIETHGGSHIHQGGIVSIFVLEGRGYSVVDGKRWDWEAGDLLLLPFKMGGVEHQHFNLDPGKPCRWLGLQYNPYRFAANPVEITQRLFHPQYKPEK